MSNDYERLPMYGLSQSETRQRFSPTATSHTRSHSMPKSRLGFNVIRPRTVFAILKFGVPTIVLLLILGIYLYEPHIELAFYDRNWLSTEIKPIEPLAGCFDPDRVSSDYNLTEGLYGARRTEVHAGLSMRMGLDCYNLAGTIQNTPRQNTIHIPGNERVQYHSYWRVDLASFGPRQEWLLKSFFATQNVETARLVLWSNGDLGTNAIIQTYLARYPDAFMLNLVDIPELAKGTALEGSKLLSSKDKKAWIDGDLIRLLLLWNYGGVWIDMDSLLTRDLDPLLEHEFVTQWDCYDKTYIPFNGALMRFRKHSPYLCEAFNLMATSTPPRADSTDWGATLYLRLWRRLVAGSIPPFKVLPFCFSEGRSCRLDNRLPDPFKEDNARGVWTMGLGMHEGGPLDTVLGNIFAVHLHNQWDKAFPKGGWVERLLLRKYDTRLES